jgi:hypothetical protein
MQPFAEIKRPTTPPVSTSRLFLPVGDSAMVSRRETEIG